MSAVVKPMRFAHSEGHTDVCYDETGEHLLSCGCDGDIRIYKGFDDSDPVSIQAGENVSMVAVKDKRIFATPGNFSVQAFTFPEGEPDGMLARFTSTINHICLNQSGTFLAAASSDFSIKVIALEDNSQKSFKGHTAPVLAVALDPKNTFLASSSCDGSFRIWNMDNQTVVKMHSILPKFNDTSMSKTLCRIGWQPGNGKYIAVPLQQEIQIYERDSWDLAFTLNKDGHSTLVSLVSWSPCGLYLATSSLEGQIIIWSISAQTAIERLQNANQFTNCSMAWNPSGNREIVYADNQGQFGVIEDIATTVLPKKSSGNKIDTGDDEGMTADCESDTDSLVAKKPHRVKQTWLDEEAEDDDDDDDEFKEIRRLKAQLAAPLDFDNADTASEVSVKKPSVVHVPVMPSLQAAFQPASTPAHLTHRFMVWNAVGIVRCHTEEDDLSTIEVEFHDTSTHHPLHITNHLNHTLAALSASAVLLACKAQGDFASKLVCLHFGSWDSSKEWIVDLPNKEDIEAVAVGQTWVAVATNKLNVRIFTLTGVQLHLVSLPGQIVSMSGHGSQLLLVYHAGNPLPNDQALASKILDLHTQQQAAADQRITLSKKSTLTWVGFSDEGTPVTVDSTGVVRFLNRSLGCTWTPVLDTKSQLKNKSDNYWVVGLVERTKQIRCILCKASIFPPTLPRPVQAVLPLKLPLCEMTTDKGEKEESFLQSKLMSSSYKYWADNGFEFDEDEAKQAETFQIQTLMKMFALACKSDREFRALDICELLPNQRSVSLAIRYAAGNRKMNLAERLNDLARRKAEEEAVDSEDEHNDPYEAPPAHWAQKSAARRIPKAASSSRPSVERQDEEDHNVDEEMEDDEEDEQDERLTRNERNTNKFRLSSSEDVDKPNPLVKRAGKAFPVTCSPSSPRGRSNPFKVLGPNRKPTQSKSFFESVEEEKKTAAETVKHKQTSDLNKGKKKRKTPKQMTLLNPIIEEPANSNVADQKPAKKKTGFKLWLDEHRSVIAEEHPEASDGDLIKLSMKQWKGLDDQEKQTWNHKAAGTSGDLDDKKRKRENPENDENENDQVSTTTTAKLVKKMKPSGAGAGAKLAAFAYSKS